jgi:catechol 2,3-dioxygenase-like lactoylglutathione lyase family enzyme
MQRTVEFYTEVLGMRLIKTINPPLLPGQHFLDMGGGVRWRSLVPRRT